MTHANVTGPIERALARIGQVLPAQAPILHFVHHNTLHGFQHLPFEDALAAAGRLTGSAGYLSEPEFRALHAAGRILDEDLDATFADMAEPEGKEILLDLPEGPVRAADILALSFRHELAPLSDSRLRWLQAEGLLLDRLPSDVSATARRRFLDADGPAEESLRVAELWQTCRELLGLPETAPHPEDLAKLSSELAKNPRDEMMNETGRDSPQAHRQMQEDTRAELDAAFAALGPDLSLRGLVFRLTGHDSLDRVRPALIRIASNYLDEGLAAWHLPGRKEGLYAAWRRLGGAGEVERPCPLYPRPEVIPLPDTAMAAIDAELRRLGLPEARWEAYLTRVALELPGWSGQFNWRTERPGYAGNQNSPPALADWLAIRLVLDRQSLDPLCRELWAVPARLPELRGYFERNLPEFLVRDSLYAGRLPEHLAAEAETLAAAGTKRQQRHAWRKLANRIYTQQRSAVMLPSGLGAGVFRLFRVSQYLGLSAAELREAGRTGADRLLAALDRLPSARRRHLWLLACERRYREDFFAALAANRGRRPGRPGRPQAQVVFCMDDREEGIRRHLEALNPDIETLGAAGFFGLPMHWRGLDDTGTTALCPVVVTPSTEVREVPRPGLRGPKDRHDRRQQLGRRLSGWFHRDLWQNLLSSQVALDLLFPAVLLRLLGNIFTPARQADLEASAVATLIPALATRVYVTAEIDTPATPERPRLGFTDAEQAERVAALLRTTGLTRHFAPLVVLMGHGSHSHNNPHRAAYDCGACSGRHGGPNARALAAMANRPKVRKLLAERGIEIPDDTRFLGAEHDTCSEAITWFDLDDLPEPARSGHGRLSALLAEAARHSARERCRRLASAPRNPGLSQALAHVAERAEDFSQPRPELGHATLAAAVIGRRTLTQGLFLDRRVFLISYDPGQDPEGVTLEGILATVGPVGAGISLEYYFSTVDNEHYGCGSKVPHNMAGLFGVMEGNDSDLRTGLPRQMIEIHEAMRLLVVVEHSPEVLAGIYGRQTELRELIGNGWIVLASLHPETGAIARFVPGAGFMAWLSSPKPLPIVARSEDAYRGQTGPVGPALLRGAETAASL